MIEKPLATDAAESARVLAAIQRSGVDAVVGYTQRRQPIPLPITPEELER